MTPGEILLGEGSIIYNAGRSTVEIEVENTSDHVIFVSSHFPFFEVNRRLVFDRAKAWGMHLDIPAGDAERWASGERRRVRLVAFGGRRIVRGFNLLTEGAAQVIAVERDERAIAALGEIAEYYPDRLPPCLRSAGANTPRASARLPATASVSATRTWSR